MPKSGLRVHRGKCGFLGCQYLQYPAWSFAGDHVPWAGYSFVPIAQRPSNYRTPAEYFVEDFRAMCKSHDISQLRRASPQAGALVSSPSDICSPGEGEELGQAEEQRQWCKSLKLAKRRDLQHDSTEGLLRFLSLCMQEEAAFVVTTCTHISIFDCSVRQLVHLAEVVARESWVQTDFAAQSSLSFTRISCNRIEQHTV